MRTSLEDLSLIILVVRSRDIVIDVLNGGFESVNVSGYWVDCIESMMSARSNCGHFGV